MKHFFWLTYVRHSCGNSLVFQSTTFWDTGTLHFQNNFYHLLPLKGEIPSKGLYISIGAPPFIKNVLDIIEIL